MKENVRNQTNRRNGIAGLRGPESDTANSLKDSLFEKGYWWQDSKEDDLLKLAGGSHYV